MNKSHYKKKIGSREEVYMGIALKTNGGLFKKDIIQKNTNGKYSYVSKKLSEIAKERNVFSNYRKRKTKANKVPINVNSNPSLQPKKLLSSWSNGTIRSSAKNTCHFENSTLF